MYIYLFYFKICIKNLIQKLINNLKLLNYIFKKINIFYFQNYPNNEILKNNKFYKLK